MAAICGLMLPAALAMAMPETSAGAVRPDIVLLTLDTVRGDALGVYGDAARTPVLDGLALSGVRFARAYTPVPLTLPAHASLLSGLDPNEHGLRDNGAGALPRAARALAEELRAAGYATAAVVGSRVLDRRFGLDRGFDSYDDRMLAERIGEFGYAERPAAEVVDAALAAAGAATGTAPGRPLFLWAHFYDAHAPYSAPGADERSRYRAEIELVDREIGRLLGGLRGGRPRWVVAVGDHGESFGEHGEHEHGYLLHEPTLRVPLIVAGPGITKGGGVRESAVGISRVAATIAALGGVRSGRLPGRPLDFERDGSDEPVYHETEFPASTFGWSPLAAVSRGRYRLLDGPKPALFDLVADPGELTNRLATETERARALRRDLRALQARRALVAESIARDEELTAALTSLGYLSGASAKRGTLDPAEGVLLLDEYGVRSSSSSRGELATARASLARLVAKSPSSAPFLTQLARAERMAGDFAAARATLATALAVNPANEFLWAIVGDLERDSGRPEHAEVAYRKAVELNPRFASAWVSLGELLSRMGRPSDEEATLRAAVEAECESGVIFTRLAEVELARGDVDAADRHARRSTELLPSWPPAWKLWAAVARRQGRPDVAAQREAAANQ